MKFSQRSYRRIWNKGMAVTLTLGRTPLALEMNALGKRQRQEGRKGTSKVVISGSRERRQGLGAAWRSWTLPRVGRFKAGGLTGLSEPTHQHQLFRIILVARLWDTYPRSGPEDTLSHFQARPSGILPSPALLSVF